METEDVEKIIDPDLEVEGGVESEEDEESEDAVLDTEEIDPFGDKWEQ